MSDPRLPESMRAAVYEAPGRIRIEDRPLPLPRGDEVLIEVEHCGICGTDLHLFLDGLGRPGTIGGHEYAGTIAAIGGGILGWTPGDRVVAGPRASCGACASCRDGRPVLCDTRPDVTGEGFQGGFAEYVRVHDSQLRRVPDGLDLRTAALAEPLAVALHAVTRSRARPGQRALVCGAGPLGLLVVAALRDAGVAEVVVSEPRETRRRRALDVGATRGCEPGALASPPMPFDIVPEPFHVAIECSGHKSAMETALGQLARGGTLVLVGTGGEPPRFDHYRILLNELVVTGAFNYDADGFERALELLASGRLPTASLIEPGHAGLTDLLPSMYRLAAGELTAKVMIDPREPHR
jgi:(R,R)-butanediol dehydrogenase / meso-butanediol dehydrogenase / diacetyl reductase